MSSDRSFADVLQDIFGNVHEIVRSEVRLAKVEILEEAVKAKSSAILLGVGAMAAIFAVLFLLLTIVFALSVALPLWASALIVGGASAIASGVMLLGGIKRFKQIHPTPERTVETMKENIQWAKQHAR